MNIGPMRIASTGAAVLAGFVAFFALLIACVALSGLIEPGGQIEAFLLARPHHRHPLQLAAAIGSLYLASGAWLGWVAARAGRASRLTSWRLLLAFGVGHVVALAWTLAGHGASAGPMVSALGHAAVLLGAAGATAAIVRLRFT